MTVSFLWQHLIMRSQHVGSNSSGWTTSGWTTSGKTRGAPSGPITIGTTAWTCFFLRLVEQQIIKRTDTHCRQRTCKWITKLFYFLALFFGILKFFIETFKFFKANNIFKPFGRVTIWRRTFWPFEKRHERHTNPRFLKE